MKGFKNLFIVSSLLVLITCSKDDGYGPTDVYSGSSNSYNPPSSEYGSSSASTSVTQYSLTVSAGTGGSVSTSGGTYDDGSSVSITATPNDGYEFTGWNGSNSTNSTISVTINSNTVIEALFTEIPAQASTETSSTETSSTETSSTETSSTETSSTETSSTETSSTETSSTETSSTETSSTETSSTETSSTETSSTETSSTETGSTESASTESASSTYNITVTAQSSSNYALSGADQDGSISGNDPSVSIKVGDTFNFNLNVPGHPFFIIINSNGGFESNNLPSGVTNNGASTGTVSWTPTEAGTYYYICEYHPSMIGTITVTQ